MNLDVTTKFKVTEEPMLRINQMLLEEELHERWLQYIIYKKPSGEFYSKKTYFAKDGYPLYPTAMGECRLNVNLPVGEYYIAVLSGTRDEWGAYDEMACTRPFDEEFWTGTELMEGSYKPKNFHTDYHFTDALWIGMFRQEYLYYESFEYTVTPQGVSAPQTVVLQPMWSYFTLEIEDGDTFYAPEKTTHLTFSYSNFDGFYLKSKLSNEEKQFEVAMNGRLYLDDIGSVSLSKMRSDKSVKTLEPSIVGAKNVPTSFVCEAFQEVKIPVEPVPPFYNDSTLSNKSLKRKEFLTYSFENGKRYHLKGKLGNSLEGGGTTIEFGEISSEEIVEVPFGN